MLKAAFKQESYEAGLDDKIGLMDVYSRRFKDLAVECSYQTQKETLGGVKTFNRRARRHHKHFMQEIARSRSEATLRHIETSNIVRAEGENHQRSFRSLEEEVVELRADHAVLHTRLEEKFDRDNAEKKAMAKYIKKVLKEFASSNPRIDPRTNDSEFFPIF